jgi:hypothetical protein
LGISWNTLTLPRAQMAHLIAAAGLNVCEGRHWLQFAHRVDASIKRDLIVAVK